MSGWSKRILPVALVGEATIAAMVVGMAAAVGAACAPAWAWASDEADAPQAGEVEREADKQEAASDGATFEKPIVPQIGPFEVRDASGRNSVQFRFTTQVMANVTNVESVTDVGTRDTTLGVEFRRLRLFLAGTLIDRSLAYSTQFNLVPGRLALLDLFFDWTGHTHARLRVGQWKVPFTRYRINTHQRLAFVDWALTTRAFGAERQIGAMLHNGYEQPQEFEYAFGVFTGINAQPSHGVAVGDAFGRAVPNPSDLTDPSAPSELHPELMLRFAWNQPGVDVSDYGNAPGLRGAGLQPRFSVGVSFAADAQPVVTDDFSARAALEALMQVERFALALTGYQGFFKASTGGYFEPAATGGIAEGIYRFNAMFELALRYAVVSYARALTDAVPGEIALLREGLDDDELSGFDGQFENAGSARFSDETTLGFNVMFAMHQLKLQTDASLLRSETAPAAVRNDARVRVQLQFGF